MKSARLEPNPASATVWELSSPGHVNDIAVPRAPCLYTGGGDIVYRRRQSFRLTRACWGGTLLGAQ